MKIYFTIDDASVLLPDQPLRRVCGWHHWKESDNDPHFCVAIPHSLHSVDAAIDRLIDLGADVLPALSDSSTPISDATVTRMGKHGVTKQHKARDVATILHGKSGFPPLRPQYH